MLKTVLYSLFLAAIAPPMAASGAEIPEELPEITVRLYNYAGAADNILSGAQQQATRILLESGVRLRWLPCTVDEQGVAEDPRCYQAQGPAAISLLVCPSQMTPKEGLPPGIFGFSLMPEQGPAMSARVYFHRLEELANGPRLRKGPLLGSMMAHEIGHLLLGINSHSGQGIMSIPWDLRELHKADLGQLGFTAKEAAAMRSETLRRLGR